ncbi:MULTISPECIES: hypothetical protein [unclassified Streptomyces]|uniref:hypothetical protein n=1 Tax=unclassified Streptomyces TaxID=2593676 RepID=UPI00224E309F|nr:MULTISPECIES: hypothetical protein [unclassified Streptomyces]MCX4524432.1 hypothetical protein [Streptomyces sp. NBC_01551]MCX4545046.1 hypothetical protein [Streptomyces sp. NBC_01565]
MRLRTAAVAAAGALTLLIAVPGSASAATGEFEYSYVGLDGQPRQESLFDPEGRECIVIPEVADPGSSEPAFSPRNRTDAFARVFTNPDCTGDEFDLRPYSGRGSERLKLRSVRFSH